ncbi:MAG: site-specific integrase [Chitinophagales bacterium]|nr:site-specific integrase [Chitinophagales bacterium]
MSYNQQIKQQINFRPATVKKGKELYVEYFCRSPLTGVMKRYRIRLNHLKMTLADKILYAENICFEINDKLLNGWNPEIDELDTKLKYKTAKQAFDEFMEFKKSDELRSDTLRAYKSFIDNFLNFLDNRYKKQVFIAQINNAVVGEFLISLSKGKIKPRTYNNYINGLKTIFDHLVNHGYRDSNPFRAIKKKRNPIKSRLYLNENEKDKIFNYLIENDRNFCRIMLMSYYTLLRRTEITKVRVGFINLERQVLYVPAEISKNRKDYNVTIPGNLISFLLELNLDQYKDTDYLFGSDFLPSASKLSPKKISDTWVKYRKILGFSDRIQFMSLRDSGIKKLIQMHIPLDDVMNHARHWSLEVTKTYLLHDTGRAIDSIKNANIDF